MVGGSEEPVRGGEARSCLKQVELGNLNQEGEVPKWPFLLIGEATLKNPGWASWGGSESLITLE